MSESSPNSPAPKIKLNPYRAITSDLFETFARSKNISLTCKTCGSSEHLIDTGADDGMVPRSSAYSVTPNGQVNMADSIHMPVIRVVCLACGNISLFATFVVELWIKQRRTAPAKRERKAADDA